MEWRANGAAFIGSVNLQDGREANVVLVAGRDNPKGAMIIAPANGGSPEPLHSYLALLTPEQVIDILCAQECRFGTALTGQPE